MSDCEVLTLPDLVQAQLACDASDRKLANLKLEISWEDTSCAFIQTALEEQAIVVAKKREELASLIQHGK
jgi:hypothetical protein